MGKRPAQESKICIIFAPASICLSICKHIISSNFFNNLFTKNLKRGCEWPEGHPDESDFKFCGKERFEDKPYCIDHCAVAYVIPEKEESEKQPIIQTT